MPCSNQTAAKSRRPILRLLGRAGRASCLSQSLLACIIIFTCIPIACYAPPERRRAFAPAAPPGWDGALADDRGNLRVWREQPGRYRLELSALSREGLQRLALFLAPELENSEVSLRSAPPLQVFRLEFWNYGERSVRLDWRSLQLRRIDDAAGNVPNVLRPLDLRRYEDEVYASGYDPFVFLYAFAPKSVYLDLQPLPDWFRPQHERRLALAPTERAALAEERLQSMEARINAMAIAAPRAGLRGAIVFESIRPGVYVLESAPRENDAAGVAPFPWPALRLTYKEYRADYAEQESGWTRAQLETLRENRAALDDAWDAEERRILRDRAELFRMHAQLRRHAELRSNRATANEEHDAGDASGPANSNE